ncbi:MAG TPA: hypothetical protein EYP08_02450 [Pyrodictiaceae archaeon]|nr:hypothetical protein [Pyrodictiaceae archaeon]HIP85210.1 hypothetical protein [Pyrodictium sp.]HIQ10968.1 hypothetical protein [Pyrodictium sp.]HIQ56154.1 hypothetical protein [Pyrodictium sp.]
MKVLKAEYIPVPLAKKLLEENVKSGEESPLVQRTMTYLSAFTKCDPNVAKQVYEKLRNDFGLKDITASMIVSLVPRTIDEIRVMLDFEDKLFETEELKKIVELLKNTCMKDSGES